VVIIGVLVYFLLVLLLLAWWLWPSFRATVQRGAAKAGSWSRGAGANVAGSAARSVGVGGGQLGALRHGLSDAATTAKRYAAPALAAVAILLMVPATVLVLRHWWAFDGYDHTVSREVNSQVAALLQGEQLVPPAPLPPELFLTREVEQVRPQTATANRQWELLDGEFRQRLLGVFKLMKERHGLEMVLIEGYRSPQRQDQLASMGASVTHAKGGESYHQFGLAADCAFLFDGRLVISEADPRAARGYELYGNIAQSLGLTWGGSWRSIKDLGHVELRRAGVMSKR
jgi:peptidoglycan LD-endopeptidase CwlK